MSSDNQETSLSPICNLEGQSFPDDSQSPEPFGLRLGLTINIKI